VRSVGGKHIHLLLLEKGLQEILGKEQVQRCYYNRLERNFYDKIKTRLVFFLGGSEKGYLSAQKYISHQLREKTSKLRCDVLNSHDPSAFLNFAGSAVAKVLTFHGYLGRETLEYHPFSPCQRKRILSYLTDLEKRALDNADFAITVDSRIQKYITQEFGFPLEKTRIIFNAVDTEAFTPITDQAKATLKRKLEIPTEQFVVLVPRRLVKKNGVLFAAKAMKEVSNFPIHMYFAGDGPQRNELLGEKLQSNIHLLGDVPHDQMVDFFQCSDLVLIPSIHSGGIEEATSLSMLEGMACGKVVAGSSIGGIQEVIKNGTNGFLIPEKDSAAIAQIILQVFKMESEKKSKITTAARKFVESNHSYRKHAAEFLNVFQQVLGAKK